MAKESAAVKITLIIAAAVVIIVLAAFFVFNSPSVSDKNTVNVQGTATVKAMPDLIGVYFQIQTKGQTSAEAKDANTEISDKLTAGLEALGIDEKEITTENYNIYPDYTWDNNGKRTDNGFVATHSLKVEIDSEDSDKLGPIIDAGVSAGAGISYINFELSEALQNQYKAEAMKLAAQDAKIKAESVAAGFNKQVGDLVSVSVNDFGYYPWQVYASSAGGDVGVAEDAALAKEATTNIQPGERDVTASVSAVYKLK